MGNTDSRLKRIEMIVNGIKLNGNFPTIVSDTAPEFPTDKAIWIDSDDLVISFQYKVGNNSIWIVPPGAGAIVDLDDVDATNIAVGKILKVAADGVTHEYVDESSGAIYKTITIAVADWSGGTTCTKTVAGVTADSFLSFAWSTDAIREKLIEFDVRPTAQGANEITFTADSTPDTEIVLIAKIEEA